MADDARLAGGARRRLPLALALGAALLSLGAGPTGGVTELRLAGLMHENLAAVNQIVEAVARDDMPRVVVEAGHLRSNADALRNLDLAAAGLDPSRGGRFDELLSVQARYADAIRKAAGASDVDQVLLNVQMLQDDACLSCHGDFRESDEGRTPPVLFMRSLLSSLQSVNRGVSMDDFALVAREARELGSIAHVLTWSQVIEAMFEVKDPAELGRFRGYLETLSTEASQMESAAMKRDGALVAQAMRRMLDKGCVACHTSFRNELKTRSRAASAQ
jgi:cytochrome c556